MKTRFLILLVAVVIILFVMWSTSDTVCKPCIIPPKTPDNKNEIKLLQENAIALMSKLS